MLSAYIIYNGILDNLELKLSCLELTNYNLSINGLLIAVNNP